MIVDKSKLKLRAGYLEGSVDECTDKQTALIAREYKKRICKNFISINPFQIESRISGDEFFVTRKIDGEMGILCYNGEDIFLLNGGGKIRMNLPCLKEVSNIFIKKDIKQAVIPCELHVDESNGRKRIYDVLSALADEKEINNLKIAPFDLIELNNQKLNFNTYEEVYKELLNIFNDSVVKLVRYQKVKSRNEITDIYSNWVEDENSEGLVVRSNIPVVYKVKPKHSIDAVIIGYTEGVDDMKGHIRTLLVATISEDNKFRIIGKVGNGLTQEERKEMYKKLSALHIESNYIESDSNHVAFRIVKPSIVVEISFNDIMLETATKYITNHILTYENDKMNFHSIVKGISIIFPVFERIRDDKEANYANVNFKQITDLYFIEDLNLSSLAELPKSEIIFREVFKKETKGKLMVLKFLVWKTNKEKINSNYPGYVFHLTNFSSERKEPLQKEVKISNDENQIMEIAKNSIVENVKKGWIKV